MKNDFWKTKDLGVLKHFLGINFCQFDYDKNVTGDMCQQDSKEGLKCKSVNLVIKNCVK